VTSEGEGADGKGKGVVFFGGKDLAERGWGGIERSSPGGPEKEPIGGLDFQCEGGAFFGEGELWVRKTKGVRKDKFAGEKRRGGN